MEMIILVALLGAAFGTVLLASSTYTLWNMTYEVWGPLGLLLGVLPPVQWICCLHQGCGAREVACQLVGSLLVTPGAVIGFVFWQFSRGGWHFG